MAKRKSVAALGVAHTARTAARRMAKDSTTNPLMGTVLAAIAGILVTAVLKELNKDKK